MRRYLHQPAAWILPIWLTSLMSMQLWIWHRDCTPGPMSKPAQVWPVESKLLRVPGRGSLVMFVSDECPCSAPSLNELDRLLSCLPESRLPLTEIVFVGPELQDSHLLWNQAKAMANVNVCRDRRGEEARRFDARTSGVVLAYDADGRLIFNGGLTTARGHEGESVGHAALRTLLMQSDHSPLFLKDEALTFGCPFDLDSLKAGDPPATSLTRSPGPIRN